MYVVDGLISGEKLKKDLMLNLRGNNKLTGYDGSKQISVELTNNVLSVDIVHETNATGGGASGAAGGAVLGFLLAGPAGTHTHRRHLPPLRRLRRWRRRGLTKHPHGPRLRRWHIT